MITLDLFIANHNSFYLPEKNPRIYEQRDRVIEKIKSLTDIDKSRVFIAADMLDFSYCIKFGLLKKLPLINDYENMNPAIYNRYCNFIFGKDDRKSREFFWGWFNLDDKMIHPELLDHMSTRYIWFSRRYLDQNKESARENYLRIADSCERIYMDETDMVFLNPRALPRAYVVGRIRVVPDEEEALKLLASEDFSPGEEVILSVSPQEAHDADSYRASEGSKATIPSLKPESISITVDMDEKGFLVLTDQYYPGWQATVDGSPTEIYRANYLFRAVAVPAGRHEVVFTYRPKSFRMGAVVSLLGLLGLLAAAVSAALRHRKKIQADPPVHHL